MFVVPGIAVHAAALKETLDHLRMLLDTPFVPVASPIGFGHDRERVLEGLKLVLSQIGRTNLDVAQALSGVTREFRPEAQAETLRDLFASLHEGWRHFITRSFGKEKMIALGKLVSSPTPDLLRILGRENDENSHSDLIAWLLSPARAPTIAAHALRALTSRYQDADVWREHIDSAVTNDLVSVRREMLIGREFAGSDDLCRVDIVVTGPGFVLAIENKVWAREHWDQTTAYWNWLEPMKCLRAGLFLSPGGLTASCPHFVPLSYLGLVSALLEGPAHQSITPAEEIVLSSYLKTLQRYILPVEIKAAIDAVRIMEAK
jgi:hypothetical protein